MLFPPGFPIRYSQTCICCQVPAVRWEDVGGMESIKAQLKEAVEWPQKNPEALARLGARTPKGGFTNALQSEKAGYIS